MMAQKMSVLTRLLTITASLVLIAAIYLPIWKIDLSAPQYPEGLHLTIWADKLGGDIEIINGLNHYIGMKTLHADDFAEFSILPWVIWSLVGLGLLSAITNKRRVFYTYFSVFLLFAVIAMLDFYRWEYQYGHNLDPDAPIQIPGMAYQPPMLGYKQLLNFGAYAIPDKGGWAFIVSGTLLAIGFVFELLRQRKLMHGGDKFHGAVKPATLTVMAIAFFSCTSGPEPIRFGKDACDYCKMIIMDKKFGGEIITEKGKVHRFDDIRCIADFIKTGKADKATSTIYFLDYNGNGNLIRSDSAFLMKSDSLKSPMGGNTAAFRDQSSLQSAIQKFNGVPVQWEDLLK